MELMLLLLEGLVVEAAASPKEVGRRGTLQILRQAKEILEEMVALILEEVVAVLLKQVTTETQEHRVVAMEPHLPFLVLQ
jgi:hypothetical protein